MKDYFAEEIDNKLKKKDYFSEEVNSISKPIVDKVKIDEPKQESMRDLLIRNLQLAGKDAYAESVAPLVHGSSTLAMGIPKLVAQEAGVENLLYPPQKTIGGKTLRVALEMAGFTLGAAVKGGRLILTGATKAMPKLAGKGVMRSMIRGGIVGAGTGLIQSPETGEGFLRTKNRLLQARNFGAIGIAAPAAVKTAKGVAGVITKSGRWIAKNVGGVSDATVAIIKRLGADRVFEPIKSRIDYIGKVIVPKAHQRIVNAVTNFNNNSKYILKALGINTDDIETLSKVDKNTLLKLKSLYGSDWNSIQKGLHEIRNSADTQFKTVLNKSNKLIDIKNTYYRLKSILYNQGWIDKQGNEKISAGVANKTKSNLVKILNDLKPGELRSGKAIKGVGSIDKIEYFNKLSELDASLSGMPKFDRIVYQVQRSLRNEAAAQIPGLAKANKMYSDAAKLLEMEKVFTKLDDVLKLESQLLSLKNVAKSQLHNKYKVILGQDLYDDLSAHLANQDFELISDLPTPQGGFYPSRAGITKAIISKASKQYYQKVAPRLKPIRSGARRMENLIEELISP